VKSQGWGRRKFAGRGGEDRCDENIGGAAAAGDLSVRMHVLRVYILTQRSEVDELHHCTSLANFEESDFTLVDRLVCQLQLPDLQVRARRVGRIVQLGPETQ
jgi:hypothetical protein